jgi:acyl-CoA synthetase (AMP-forming)/AMP-acid ligase II
LARSTAEAFFARYGVHIKQGYGLAELSVICINRHEGERVVYDSIGTPLDGIEWRLSGGDNLSDAENLSGDAKDGELIVRSKAMFSGYLNNPEQTQEKLQNGWLHTGDVVSVDADGLFRVIGRKEDFVKINGYKVYASEVERAIIGIDWIKECAVIAEKNDVGAEFMVAYLVPADSDTVTTVPEKDVISFLRQRLSEYKIPKKFVLRNELPKNALGKILKSRIQGQP